MLSHNQMIQPMLQSSQMKAPNVKDNFISCQMKQRV
jgi:hypothetical protein